ncbi:hypothetical protein Dsin_005343 [Dipteronia sinensis]|uniref:Uncharacterized protein n=1 Tax=Dipteronia sinensis TaxID=43782 RepID=A0AAE0AWA7_9ROSI|nr:hypothetical protein Dsin_005343 [Dipteronia sinensis]
MATFHHQIAYRLQDHALDLSFPGHSRDTIFIKAEREDEVPTIIQIPKQLPRDQLTELMPLSWIINYEKAFQNVIPPLTGVPTTETTPNAPPDPQIFQSLLIKPIVSEEGIPIHSFEADGSTIYTDKINGHFI